MGCRQFEATGPCEGRRECVPTSATQVISSPQYYE